MMVVPLLCSSFRRPLRQGIRPCGPPTQLYSFFFISQSPQYRVVVFLLGSVIIIVVRFFFFKFIFMLSSRGSDLQWKIHL